MSTVKMFTHVRNNFFEGSDEEINRYDGPCEGLYKTDKPLPFIYPISVSLALLEKQSQLV